MSEEPEDYSYKIYDTSEYQPPPPTEQEQSIARNVLSIIDDLNKLRQILKPYTTTEGGELVDPNGWRLYAYNPIHTTPKQVMDIGLPTSISSSTGGAEPNPTLEIHQHHSSVKDEEQFTIYDHESPATGYLKLSGGNFSFELLLPSFFTNPEAGKIPKMVIKKEAGKTNLLFDTIPSERADARLDSSITLQDVALKIAELAKQNYSARIFGNSHNSAQSPKLIIKE